MLARRNATEACLVGLSSPTLAEQVEALGLYHSHSLTQCLQFSRAHVPERAQRAGSCNPAVVFVDLSAWMHSWQRVVVGPLKPL